MACVYRKMCFVVSGYLICLISFGSLLSTSRQCPGVKPTLLSNCPVVVMNRSGTHQPVAKAVFAGPKALAYVDRLDPVLAYSDSNDNKVPSIAECDAYSRRVSILFELMGYGHRTMDFDTARVRRSSTTITIRFYASNL